MSMRGKSWGGLGACRFAFFAQRFAIQVEVMRLMHQAVENRIRQRRVTDGLMPMLDG